MLVFLTLRIAFSNLSSSSTRLSWLSGKTRDKKAQWSRKFNQERLRLENHDVRVMVISPRVVESELAHTISAAGAREPMQDVRKIALPPDAIGRAIAYAMEQNNPRTRA